MQALNRFRDLRMEWDSASFPPTAAPPPTQKENPPCKEADEKQSKVPSFKGNGSSSQTPRTELQQEPFSKGAQSTGSWEGGAHTEEKGGLGTAETTLPKRGHSGAGPHLQVNGLQLCLGPGPESQELPTFLFESPCFEVWNVAFRGLSGLRLFNVHNLGS